MWVTLIYKIVDLQTPYLYFYFPLKKHERPGKLTEQLTLKTLNMINNAADVSCQNRTTRSVILKINRY